MANVNDLKSSKFLTKHDVDPPITVTIKSYEESNVAMESQKPELKWILYFNELEKPLVLNSTNGQRIQIVTGSGEFKDWIGKKIILYNDKTVSFAGQITGGIRVQVPQDVPVQQQDEEQELGMNFFCRKCQKNYRELNNDTCPDCGGVDVIDMRADPSIQGN